jgi:hypothetical protein
LKVFVRIKELDVVSKRQQEEEGEEINVDHLWLDVEGDYSVSRSSWNAKKRKRKLTAWKRLRKLN